VNPAARLYWDDPRCLEFDAQVLEVRPGPEGAGVVLDRSAFYPTSGGQPHDTGTLDGRAVDDVTEAADGTILHRMQDPPAAGARVRGRIDAERRRDHMQQHSGQHLLSATVLALYGRETHAFHLGRESCSIDLAGGTLAAAEVARLEDRVNELVWEARPVVARFLTPGEEAALRKPPPPGSGPVRVIEIESWDQNACCGTHVARTSEIGLVKLLGQEKVKDKTRLGFVCGMRALAVCREAWNRVESLALQLTCHPDALAAKVTAMQTDARTARKAADAMRRTLAGFEAAEWTRTAPAAGGIAIVTHAAAEAGAEVLQAWADALVERGAVALLGSAAPRAALLFARPDGVELDLRPALQAALPAIDGRGGGPPGRVQAAGNRPDGVPDALAAAAASIREVLERP